MTELMLKATKREPGKQLGTLREEGYVPGVVYGRDIASTPLAIPVKEVERVYSEAGESRLVDFVFTGEKEERPTKVLIHQIDRDPVTMRARHIDLYQVRMDEEIETEVPLVFEGISEAVKVLGGSLVKNIHEIRISCLPAALPGALTVDISVLKTFEDKVFVRDITRSEGVEVLSPAQETVAFVEPPRSEEELKALESEVVEDVSKVESSKEKPEKEEEAEEGEGAGAESKAAEKESK